MDLVPIKNGLFTDVRQCEISSKIYTRLQELNLLDKKYVNDTEFVLYLMNIIEHLVTKKDGIDKKQLLFSILKTHFSATDQELIWVDRTIEFLFKNKQIKKVSFYKIFKTSIWEWFKKR